MSRKYFRGLIGAVTLGTAGIGLAFLPVAPPAIAQAGRAIKVPGAGISFVPPANYKTRAKSSPTSPIAFSYVGARGSGSIAPNINLSERPAPATLKIATPALVEASVQVVKRAVPGYKIVAKGATTVDGEPAAFLTGALTVNHQAMETKQVMVVHKKQIYVFTFGTEFTDFGKQVGAFDALVASVKWL